MAGKKTGKPSDYNRGDNTLQFRLPDPKIDGVAALADHEPSRLERYRAFFSGYFLAHSNDAAGLIFDNFIDNIRAAGFAKIGTQDMDVFFTKSAAFLVFMETPDFGMLKGMFPDINFIERTSIAECGEEGRKAGKVPLALIRVTGAELASILQASHAEDVIEDELALQRICEVQEMLEMAEITAGAMDHDTLMQFSAQIVVCHELDDGSVSKSYFVALRESDLIYTITTDPEGAICGFTYSGTPYFISVTQFKMDEGPL